MEKGLVSVIMPVHNTEKYIERTLDSLEAQTYSNLELCIAFDNCSDRSMEIFLAHPIAKRSKWVQCNHRQPAATRNEAIRMSIGEYVAYLDSDDWWEQDKLDKCVKEIQKNGTDFIWHDEYFVDVNSKILKFHRSRTMKKYFPEMLWLGNCITTSSVVHKNFYLENKDENFLFDESISFRGVEDFKLWLNFSKRKLKFSHIREFLGYYLIHESSVSRNKAKMYTNLGNVIDSELSELKKTGNYLGWILSLPYRTRVHMVAKLHSL